VKRSGAVPRPHRTPARRGPDGGDRGSASLEFVITAVAVIALIFTAIQASTYFWARSIAAGAAQEGANAQRAYNAAPGAGQARANDFLASTGDGLSDTTISVTDNGQQVQVTVTGHCLSVIPGFCALFPIRATVHGTVERITTS
jgi:hypothetical protein